MSHHSGEDSKVKYCMSKKPQKQADNSETGKRHNFGEKKYRQHDDDQKTCTRCRYRHGKDTCPAKWKTCALGLCKKPNYFKKMCRSKSVLVVDNEHISDDGEEYYAGSIQMYSPVNSVDHEQLEWTQTVMVNNKPVKCHLDTGAMCNILPYSLLQEISHRKLKSTRNTLKS